MFHTALKYNNGQQWLLLVFAQCERKLQLSKSKQIEAEIIRYTFTFELNQQKSKINLNPAKQKGDR